MSTAPVDTNSPVSLQIGQPGLGEVETGTVAFARAPLRISFCGGGTDLAAYASRHGGLVLNATIRRYAYATLRPLNEKVVRVQSLDYHVVHTYGLNKPLPLTGELDLVTACLRRLPLDGRGVTDGFDLFLETHAPPGSGLGASSALVVAVIGTFQAWHRLVLSPYQIADLAYQIERKDVGISGGMQDQYAAAFGGFNLMEFRGEGDVVVNPLRVDPQVVRELEYNSVLVFTGTTRHSDKVIESQLANITSGHMPALSAFARMKELAMEAKDALLRGKLGRFAEILHEAWQEKKATSPVVTSDRIDGLYEEARKLGAVGGKISGAGGGGFMYLLVPFDSKPAVIARMKELGAHVSPLEFQHDGLQSWLGGSMGRRLR